MLGGSYRVTVVTRSLDRHRGAAADAEAQGIVAVEGDLRDATAMRALLNGHVDAIASLPLERLQSGTSEIRNWITTAGAVQHLDMEVFDYVPCYRSEAGTGNAMGFVYWQ